MPSPASASAAAAAAGGGPGRPSEAEAEAEEAEECAICFEDTGHRTLLPCHCNLVYCRRCWDRALAQSVNTCGQPRCPSCRSPVRVDFDAATRSLTFSRAEAVELLDERSPERVRQLSRLRNQVVNNLLEQARPEQTRLLRQHGAAHPDLAQGAQAAACAAASPAAAWLDRGAEGPVALEAPSEAREALLARWQERPPECVCGSQLVRISGRERLRRTFCKHGARPADLERAEAAVEQCFVRGVGCAVCDLCDGQVSGREHVWTCEKGDLTILHATAYDVCDSCFLLHAQGLVQVQGPTGEVVEI